MPSLPGSSSCGRVVPSMWIAAGIRSRAMSETGVPASM